MEISSCPRYLALLRSRDGGGQGRPSRVAGRRVPGLQLFSGEYLGDRAQPRPAVGALRGAPPEAAPDGAGRVGGLAMRDARRGDDTLPHRGTGGAVRAGRRARPGAALNSRPSDGRSLRRAQRDRLGPVRAGGAPGGRASPSRAPARGSGRRSAPGRRGTAVATQPVHRRTQRQPPVAARARPRGPACDARRRAPRRRAGRRPGCGVRPASGSAPDGRTIRRSTSAPSAARGCEREMSASVSARARSELTPRLDSTRRPSAVCSAHGSRHHHRRRQHAAPRARPCPARRPAPAPRAAPGLSAPATVTACLPAARRQRCDDPAARRAQHSRTPRPPGHQPGAG